MKTVIYCVGVSFVAAIVIAAIGLISAIPVMLLWNAVIPAILHLPVITYWQAYALYLLCSLLFAHSSVKSKDD